MIQQLSVVLYILSEGHVAPATRQQLRFPWCYLFTHWFKIHMKE